MYGWTGNMLRVDLTTASARYESIPIRLLHEYLGGRGMAVRMMRNYFRLDPLDPNMPLIFSCGPLCGSSAPCSDRVSIVSRSPLTGTIFDCTAGGEFAWNLKSADVDMIFISGRSPAPVVVVVKSGCVEFIDDKALRGMDIPSRMEFLRGFGSIAAIGPAGENGVLYAGIGVGTENSIGRGGLGTVMGAKNLQALAVSGEAQTSIADPELFDKTVGDILRLFKSSPFLMGPLGLSHFGSAALVDLVAQRRMVPTDNFQKTFFEHTGDYSGPAIKQAYVMNDCKRHFCPIRCVKLSGEGSLLPEYDVLSHFGALNGIRDLTAIVLANRICNNLGMDGVSAAATLAAWSEIRDSFLGPKELSGILSDIAWLRGKGKGLGLGSRRLAEKLGRPELSMSVKSLELPAYDPRGAYGMALAYCVNTRGGCHLSASTVFHELLRKPVPTDRFSFSGKARIISIAEDGNAAADSLAVCRFAFLGIGMEECAALLSAATGVDYSAAKLLEIGRRVCMTEHFYNCVNGFSRKDDILPGRFFLEPGSDGDGIRIPALNRELFDEQLSKYYHIRGLNNDGCFDNQSFLEDLP